MDIKVTNGRFKFEGDNFELEQLTNVYGERSSIMQVVHWYDTDYIERAGCRVVPNAWFWSEDFDEPYIPESILKTLHYYVQWCRLYEKTHPDWTNDGLMKDLSETINDAVSMQI